MIGGLVAEGELAGVTSDILLRRYGRQYCDNMTEERANAVSSEIREREAARRREKDDAAKELAAKEEKHLAEARANLVHALVRGGKPQQEAERVASSLSLRELVKELTLCELRARVYTPSDNEQKETKRRRTGL